MPIATAKDLQFALAHSIAQREQHDTFNLSMLLVECVTELQALHDHAVDMGIVDCQGIPGGCPTCAMIRKVTRPA